MAESRLSLYSSLPLTSAFTRVFNHNHPTEQTTLNLHRCCVAWILCSESEISCRWPRAYSNDLRKGWELHKTEAQGKLQKWADDSANVLCARRVRDANDKCEKVTIRKWSALGGRFARGSLSCWTIDSPGRKSQVISKSSCHIVSMRHPVILDRELPVAWAVVRPEGDNAFWAPLLALLYR